MALRIRCRRRRHLAVPLAAVALCAASVTLVPAATGAPEALYRNARAAKDDRVRDLLHRMTLDEKIGQLQQIAVDRLQGDCRGGGGELTESCMKTVLQDCAVGSVLSGGGMGPPVNTPADWARMVDAVQRYAVDRSRLHVPVLYGVDAVHGHNNVLGATVRVPADVSLRTLHDTLLPPYRTAVGAGARTVMVNSGAVKRCTGHRIPLPAHHSALATVGIHRCDRLGLAGHPGPPGPAQGGRGLPPCRRTRYRCRRRHGDGAVRIT